MDVFLSYAIIGIVILNLGMLGYVVYIVLRIKKDLVDDVMGRVRPMIGKGKTIADSGKREFGENKERFQAVSAALKGLAASVKPQGEDTGPKTQFGYRHLLTAFSVLGSLRRGLKGINQTRKAMAQPPEPPKGKRKVPPRRLGTLEMLPGVIRLVREVRRALR